MDVDVVEEAEGAEVRVHFFDLFTRTNIFISYLYSSHLSFYLFLSLQIMEAADAAQPGDWDLQRRFMM